MKRLLTLLLAAVMLSSVACGSSGNSSDTSADSTSETVGETTADPHKPVFESQDYDTTFHILANNSTPFKDYFFAMEQTGDVLDDAIYNRDTAVEEYLGIEISYELSNEYSDLIMQSNMADDDSYQLVLTHCIKPLASMVTNRLLYDLNELEYLDLSKEYWNQSCIENLAVYGKNYYAAGDYLFHDVNCIMFNKHMIDEYKLENPYELVRSGKWTLDKLLEMSAVVAGETSGDGNYDINDTYGITCDNDWKWNSFIYAAGLTMTTENDKGNMQLFENSERMMTLVEKIDRLVNKTHSAFTWQFAAPAEQQLTIASGRTLFQIEATKALGDYRSSEVDFGIIPYPKFDEAQENYINNDWTGLMCVPIGVKNPEMVGKALELFSFYSSFMTKPIYYEKVLGDKLARDPDSKEMLDLIFDSIIYDAGFNYFGQSGQMQSLFYVLSRSVIKGGNADFASIYASNAPSAKSEIENFYAQVAENQ